jgi:hypothetical protein
MSHPAPSAQPQITVGRFVRLKRRPSRGVQPVIPPERPRPRAGVRPELAHSVPFDRAARDAVTTFLQRPQDVPADDVGRRGGAQEGARHLDGGEVGMLVQRHGDDDLGALLIALDDRKRRARHHPGQARLHLDVLACKDDQRASLRPRVHRGRWSDLDVRPLAATAVRLVAHADDLPGAQPAEHGEAIVPEVGRFQHRPLGKARRRRRPRDPGAADRARHARDRGRGEHPARRHPPPSGGSAAT